MSATNVLDGLCLSPLVDGEGRLVATIITFENAPGLELRLSGRATEELRDGLAATLARAPKGIKHGCPR